MFPYLINKAGFSIPAYPILYGVGIALFGATVLILGRLEGCDARKLVHIIPVAGLSIVIGARAFYVLQHIGHPEGSLSHVLDPTRGGQVLYGGLILGTIVVILYCRVAGLSIPMVFDFFAVGGPLGLAVGRLGCFCFGCCYGRPSGLPWAVTFPKCMNTASDLVGSPPFMRHMEQGLLPHGAEYSIPVQPAQIYASIASFVLFLTILWLWKTGRMRGRLLFIYLILYSACRFGLEFTRDNEMAFRGLTIPQVVSLAVAAGTFLAVLLIRRTNRTHACTVARGGRP